jgi:hypothetical protein
MVRTTARVSRSLLAELDTAQAEMFACLSDVAIGT